MKELLKEILKQVEDLLYNNSENYILSSQLLQVKQIFSNLIKGIELEEFYDKQKKKPRDKEVFQNLLIEDYEKFVLSTGYTLDTHQWDIRIQRFKYFFDKYNIDYPKNFNLRELYDKYH